MATLIGSDAQALVPVAADIRLVPPGVILPPVGTPTAAFKLSPTSPATNMLVLFDASTSCGGALVNNTCPATADAISTYTWSFGDGSSGTGVSPSHTYTTALSYIVTLTVTTTRGAQASANQTVAVSQTTGPTAEFVFSPSSPLVGQQVNFSADPSKAALGHTITQYTWNWGDGTPAGSGLTQTHTFSAVGSYNVILSVADDTGQKAVVTHPVSIGSTNAPTANFTFTPPSPVLVNQTVIFNGVSSTSAGGTTIVSYQWTFGDNTVAVTSGSSVIHQYPSAGSYTVTLTVTDSLNRTSAPATLPIQVQ